MRSLSLLFVATSAVCGSTLAPRSLSVKLGYQTTFFDDFTASEYRLPLSSLWQYDLGTSYPGGAVAWGNNEVETYTKNKKNIHISYDNTLVITPRLKNGSWTSARIETRRSNFAAKAGGKLFIESSIKLGNAPATQQQGIWPAFWALGQDFRGNYTNWPATSELDFLEAVSGTNKMYSTAHCGISPGGPCNEYTGLGSGGVPFTRGVFHTIGFEVDRSMIRPTRNATWRDETLSWFLDDRKIFTINGTTVNDRAAWSQLAHQGHFLLLNVAVGGNWPGAPNNATIEGESVNMEVDYVGVWNKN